MARKQQQKPASKKTEVAVGDKAVRFKHRNLTFIRAK